MVGSAIPGQVGLLLYKITEQIRESKPVSLLRTLLQFRPLGSCLGFPQGWILSQIKHMPPPSGFSSVFLTAAEK